MYSLANLDLSAMTTLGASLRGLGAEATSMEDVATRIVSLLYESFSDPQGKPSCALVRLFRTMRFSDLEPELRDFGSRLMPEAELTPETRCLTLLGTRGTQSQWNSRRESGGHQTIPLPSASAVDGIPMISQLIAQLGIEVAKVVEPDPTLVLEAEQHAYNVFFVPDAGASPFIPAKGDFVEPHGIQSVLGCGGLLPSGEMFAVLMFAQEKIKRSSADLFRNAALNIKLSLLPFDDGPVFSPTGASG